MRASEDLWLPSCNQCCAPISVIRLFVLTPTFRKSADRWLRENGEGRRGNCVRNEAGIASVVADQTCVEKLAQLFPNASPVRIPVRVMAIVGRRRQSCRSRR